MKNKFWFLLVIVCLLLITTISAEEIDNSLKFSAMETKYLSTDVVIETPLYLSGYKENDEFTYRTAIFSNNHSQIVEMEAYYLDENNNKVFAEIITENENRYAIFKVRPIKRSEYVFYISGSIVSENKIIFNNLDHSLENIGEEEKEFIKSTRFIQSNSLEIMTIAKYLKTTDNTLENLVNVTNWVHDYLEYDYAYVDVVHDSKRILSDKKGVCDEFAILQAAILRAQGYPVKYVVGYANTSQEWGPHAWLEVYLPNQGWIPVDPTYNEVGFVDSSHVVLERLKDPIESKDSVTATSNLEIRFGEKKHNFKNKEAISYEERGYKDILKMKMNYTKDNLTTSPFVTKLSLQNTTQNPLTILVVSQISEDFKQIFPKSRKKVYYLGPFEEKTVDYFFILPNLNNSYTYGFGFSSQLGEITEYVNIHKNKGIYQELFLVRPPNLYFRENNFYFEQNIFNYTDKDKNLNFEFYLNEQKIVDSKNVSKKTEATYIQEFPIVEDANFSYLISGDYSFSGNTVFYKEIEQIENIKKVIDSNYEDVNDYGKLFNQIESKRIDEKSELNYFVVVFVVIFILFIMFLFVSKSIKKQGIQ